MTRLEPSRRWGLPLWARKHPAVCARAELARLRGNT